MSMRIQIVAGLAGVLAACSPSPQLSSQSSSAAPSAASGPAPSVAKGSGVLNIKPGEYHTTNTVVSISGLPPAMTKAVMAHPSSGVDDCVTTDDIKKLMHDGVANNDTMKCTENTITANNGTISGNAKCRTDDGASGTLNFSGAYTATHVQVEGQVKAHTSVGEVTETMRMVSDRTGACKS